MSLYFRLSEGAMSTIASVPFPKRASSDWLVTIQVVPSRAD